MLIYKIMNNKVILWVKEYPNTYLFDIPTKIHEAHAIYKFWYMALRYPSHDLMRYVNIFSDSNLIQSKL
jgi:hypothetical protein